MSKTRTKKRTRKQYSVRTLNLLLSPQQPIMTPTMTSKYVLVHISGKEKINAILKSGQMKTAKALKSENEDLAFDDPTPHAHIFFFLMKAKLGKTMTKFLNRTPNIILNPFTLLKDRTWYTKRSVGYGITYGRGIDVREYFIASSDPKSNVKIEAALDAMVKAARKYRGTGVGIGGGEVFVEPDDIDKGTLDIRPSLLHSYPALAPASTNTLIIQMQEQNETKTTKRKRCPNGTRRNRST